MKEATSLLKSLISLLIFTVWERRHLRCFALVSILCSISILFALYCYIGILIFRRIMFNTEITKSAETPDIEFIICS